VRALELPRGWDYKRATSQRRCFSILSFAFYVWLAIAAPRVDGLGI
jgi:hypothetical protein